MEYLQILIIKKKVKYMQLTLRKARSYLHIIDIAKNKTSLNARFCTSVHIYNSSFGEEAV